MMLRELIYSRLCTCLVLKSMLAISMLQLSFFEQRAFAGSPFQAVPPMYSKPVEGLPEPLKEVSFEQRMDAQVPLDATFKNEHGEVTTIGQILGQGKPVVLVPAYNECPNLCGMIIRGTLATFKKMDWTPGNQFHVVNLSFDPSEGPELALAKKQNVIENYGKPDAASGWNFLTGKEDQIRRVTDAVGFKYKWDEEQKQFAHASGIIVLTPEGRVSKYLFGVEYMPRDLKFALMEASQNKIGNLADKLLLFCFHYNPAEGKYSFAIFKALRIGGFLTALALAMFIVIQLLRERRRRLGQNLVKEGV